MQESHEKKIRQNIYTLVEVTSSLEELLGVLREKNVLSEEDQMEIEKADSLFDKKSQLFWLITKKDDSAFDALVDAFKATGNEKGVEILTQETPSSPPPVQASDNSDQEGVNLAEDMEKEFDRIQSQAEEESEKDSGVQVTEEVLKREEVPQVESSPEESSHEAEVTQIKEVEQVRDDDEVESEVRVEVTPPESEPEEEEVIAIASALAEEHKAKEEVVEEEKAEEFEAEEEKVEEVKPQAKQVSFETPKEFIISKKSEPEESLGDDEVKSLEGKSLVAQNRELFEKNAPKGVKVRYSFKKDEPIPEAAEKKVANLKNFFQNLSSGSKDDSNAGVERRNGNKMGGVHPNRRTMAS